MGQTSSIEPVSDGNGGALRVRLLHVGGLALITAGGQVDVNTSELLTGCGALALARRPHRVSVDLSDVTFFSAAGIHALLDLQRAAAAATADFRLRAPSLPVLLALSAAGVASAFRMDTSKT
ncbi:MAG TPA: STAS domain-containing protein [Actinocrinis sp.]